MELTSYSAAEETKTAGSWARVFKRKNLTDRQLWKVKFSTVAILCVVAYSLVMDRVTALYTDMDGNFVWKGNTFEKQAITTFKSGQVVEYETNDRDEFCASFILLPGFALQPTPLLAILYIIFIVYIFVGVAIISDIFMDSITVITAAKRVIATRDVDGNTVNREVTVWNATVANLTLMALGSSAPEIMLNVIETVMTLGQKPGELGASTIVGSAAFNLLVISAVSIMAVDEESEERTEEEIEEDGTGPGVKKIEKMGVFTVTTIFSIVAYIWMYIALMDEIVEPYEAWLTLALFPILILFALIADKISSSKAKASDDGDGPENLPVLNTADFIAVLTAEKPDE